MQSLNNTHEQHTSISQHKSTVIGLSPIKTYEKYWTLRRKKKKRRTDKDGHETKERQTERARKNALAAEMELAPHALLLTFLVGLCKLYP